MGVESSSVGRWVLQRVLSPPTGVAESSNAGHFESSNGGHSVLLWLLSPPVWVVESFYGY